MTSVFPRLHAFLWVGCPLHSPQIATDMWIFWAHYAVDDTMLRDGLIPSRNVGEEAF